MRAAIEMILEEKLEMEARKARSRAAEQALAALQRRLNEGKQ